MAWRSSSRLWRAICWRADNLSSVCGHGCYKSRNALQSLASIYDCCAQQAYPYILMLQFCGHILQTWGHFRIVLNTIIDLQMRKYLQRHVVKMYRK